MDKIPDKLFESIPQSIREAAQSFLGILALIIITFSILAAVLFYNDPVNVRIFIFVFLLLGIVLLFIEVFRVSSKPTGKELMEEIAKKVVEEAVKKELRASPHISIGELGKEVEFLKGREDVI